MTPTYPVGLSLLMVALAPLTGWDLAPHVTMWLHAMAGVGLMFALARAFGLSKGLALGGALILALCPLYLLMGLQAMSDVPALVWCIASVCFAWRARSQPLWALAAGASVGIGVLVRPSDLLIMAPVALCLGLRWQRWGWLVLGGVPAAAFFAAYNHALYGHAFTTGYGAVGFVFSAGFVPLTLENYARWLPVLLTPAIVLGLALPWVTTKESRLPAAICGAWAVPLFVFYAFYYHTHEQWWYLRFLLPAFPALILAMLLVVQRASARATPHLRIVLGAIGTAAIVAWGAYWIQNRWALEGGRGEKVYPDSAQWARRHLPANAVIIAMQMTGALLYSTDLTFVRYEPLSPAQLANLERVCSENKRPIYAMLFPEEREHVFRAMPGGWTQVAAMEHVTLWKRTPQTSAPAVPWHVFATAQSDNFDVIARSIESGWYDRERSYRHSWTWSSGRGAIELEATPQHSGTVQFAFSLRAIAPSVVTITQAGVEIFRGEVGTDRIPVNLAVRLQEGPTRLDFASSTPGVVENARPDARVLSFAVYDPRLTLPENIR